MAEIIKVHVETDHLQRLVHDAQPVRAVAELIWNALDADATRVVVKVIESELGGMLPTEDGEHSCRQKESDHKVETHADAAPSRAGTFRAQNS